jgi:hypothetical protein
MRRERPSACAARVGLTPRCTSSTRAVTLAPTRRPQRARRRHDASRNAASGSRAKLPPRPQVRAKRTRAPRTACTPRAHAATRVVSRLRRARTGLQRTFCGDQARLCPTVRCHRRVSLPPPPFASARKRTRAPARRGLRGASRCADTASRAHASARRVMHTWPRDCTRRHTRPERAFAAAADAPRCCSRRVPLCRRGKQMALECTRKAHLQTTLECTSRATCQVRALARTCAPKCALKRRSSMCLSAALR